MILALLTRRQFIATELVGGPLMIVILALLSRLLLRGRLIDAARTQADRGLAASTKGHAVVGMSITREGFTSVSHVLAVEWAAIFKEFVASLVIDGAITAWKPDSFWQHFFLSGRRLATGL